MADDKTLNGQQDRTRINLGEDYEIEYWMNELGVSREKLVDLVETHNGSAAAVRKELGLFDPYRTLKVMSA